MRFGAIVALLWVESSA